ncbi:site-specific DNA-methyltransferase [Ignavibacteriales bacterium]
MKKKEYENLSKEELIRKISKLEKNRYGLVWEEKLESVATRCEHELPILIEQRDKEILIDESKPYHFIIEGDNFHVLSTLNFTHKKKIDVIYIDPPYNKGNKDFKYNDNYVDKEDTFRHSKWLSFMDKRLRLAKKLLSDNGILFISIDDVEFAQLKLLCNKIFQENNFLGTITWEKRTKAQNTESAKTMLQLKTEYILVYKASSNKIEFTLETNGEKIYDLEDEKGIYRLKVIEQMSAKGMRGRESMIYDIIGVHPREGFQWKIGLQTKKLFEERGDLVLIDRKPFQKIRPSDESKNKFIPFWSHFFPKDAYGTAETGKSELTEILGNDDHNFETVKPVKLIKKLLFHINLGKRETILDFFAGSGTTGHAVLELNQEDNGNRQFILCTNNENNICDEITYPRLQNVIKGYGSKTGAPGNIKYFKTDFLPNVLTDNDKRILVNNSTELLCMAENTFKSVVQDTKKLDFAIFMNTYKYTAIIYDEDSVSKCCEALEIIKPKQKVVIYVFSYDHNYEEVDFENLSFAFEVKPIPEAILNVYRKISKARKR